MGSLLDMNDLTLSIVIPAYNEERTIVKILDRIAGVTLINGIKKQIIIINDCSTDQTEAVIVNYISAHDRQDIIYQKQPVNSGKGYAIRTGIEKATGNFLIVQDADLEYDPQEYNILLQPMVSDYADVVFGSRFTGGHPHRVLFFWHTTGNKMLTFFSNLLTNMNLTDMETCYKLFRMDVIKAVSLTENRFGFEPEVTAKVARIKGVRIYEVGISYYGRTYAEGKKINWKDGFRAIYCIIKYNIFS